MSKQITCKVCNTPIASSVKQCPCCGTKIEHPFYKKPWFITIAVILVILIIGSLGNNGELSDSSTNQQDSGNTNSAMSNNSGSSNLVNGMRPEFKAAMDSYEDFYDEYCDFAKKLASDPSNLELLAEYAKLQNELTQMDAAFEKWENSDLNAVEEKYFLEVQLRVSQKLMETLE